MVRTQLKVHPPSLNTSRPSSSQCTTAAIDEAAPPAALSVEETRRTVDRAGRFEAGQRVKIAVEHGWFVTTANS